MISLDDLSGPGLTAAAVELFGIGGDDFKPHERYVDLQRVFYRIGVTPVWTFKKGIQLEITSHGITSKGQDPEWEYGYGEANELGLHLALHHYQETHD